MNPPHTPQQVIYVTQGKSRVSYILLALFFGGLGFHDFYAGYTGKGLLKIIVSVLGVLFTFVGGVGAVAMAAGGELTDTNPAPALMPLFGMAMLGLQSFYVLIQIFTVNRDSKGVPFS
jgi:TM2 domain-containing membrane protein YozV